MAVRPLSPATPGRVALALTVACLLVGCSNEDEPQVAPSPAPSTTSSESSDAAGESVSVPPTPTQRALGETAAVAVSSGDRRGEVALTVTKVRKGRIKDLSDFVLDKRTRRSTPYYVDVRVENTGSPDLSGASLPLWGLDSTDTVLPPAEIRGTFGRCDSAPMPKNFTRGKSARTCLMFLVPRDAALQAVQYRPSDSDAGSGIISWPAG